ncbi:ninjurin-2 [Emys orbicularis]|uniref:ninjurin-2 n=1 Tax=Emys orbicularis TaxID=82168 RepID=UPI0031FCB050
MNLQAHFRAAELSQRYKIHSPGKLSGKTVISWELVVGEQSQNSGSGTTVLAGNPGSRRDNPVNINHYATKKSVAESMLDVALFMANVTQLKAVLEQRVSFQYYATLISLISISLFFQVVIGILLIIIARLNLNDVSKQHRLNVLNNVATALIFITVILNIFITGFGVQKTGL